MIAIKGYSTWTRVVQGYITSAGYRSFILKSIDKFPVWIRWFKPLNLVFFIFSIKWIRAKYMILVGVMNPHYLRISLLYNKKIICYWVGSDVMRLKIRIVKNERSNIDIYKKKVYKHFAITQGIVNELKDYGIEAELLEITSANVLPSSLPSLPAVPAVLTYWSHLRRDFYGGNTIDRLALDFPDLPFYVLGSDGKNETSLPNLIYMNRVENIEEVFSKTSILIRLPEHDGLSSMVLEMLARGRWIIYSQDFPFTYKPENYEMIKVKLKELIEKKTLNVEAMNYIRENYTPEKINNTAVVKFRNIFS